MAQPQASPDQVAKATLAPAAAAESIGREGSLASAGRGGRAATVWWFEQAPSRTGAGYLYLI